MAHQCRGLEELQVGAGRRRHGAGLVELSIGKGVTFQADTETGSMLYLTGHSSTCVGMCCKSPQKRSGWWMAVTRDVFSCRATRETELAGVTSRHYTQKNLKFELGVIARYQAKYKLQGQIGKPHKAYIEILRRISDIDAECMLWNGMQNVLVLYKLQCESEFSLTKKQLLDHMQGVNACPELQDWMHVMPHSFTTQAKEAMALKVANISPDFKKIKGMVKPNETLGKIKPRLIQHLGQEGSAHEGPIGAALTALYYSDMVWLESSIKRGGMRQVEDRIAAAVTSYGTGGVASNDYGSYDSSVLENKVPEDDGIRGIVEKAIFEKLFAVMGTRFHADKGTLHRKVYLECWKVKTSDLPRCSGDINTSNGNADITRKNNEVQHIVADSVLEYAEMTLKDPKWCGKYPKDTRLMLALRALDKAWADLEFRRKKD